MNNHLGLLVLPHQLLHLGLFFVFQSQKWKKRSDDEMKILHVNIVFVCAGFILRFMTKAGPSEFYFSFSSQV